MNRFNTRDLNRKNLLGQLGLMQRPSTPRRALTLGSMVGLGAALGVGAMLASRTDTVKRLFKRASRSTPVRMVAKAQAAGA